MEYGATTHNRTVSARPCGAGLRPERYATLGLKFVDCKRHIDKWERY
jgi:hypothetical protein